MGEPCEQSLWSQILLEASSSRAAPQKCVLLLGDRHTGKGSIADALRGAGQSERRGQALTGLDYQYLNIKDPQDEETLARCSMYLCSKPDPEFLNLPLAHPSSNTIALLCLDWSQPQRFLHSLLTWLSALDRLCHSWTDHVDNSRERPDYAWQNAKDRLSRLWQSYQEPTLKPDGSVQAPLPNATTSNPEASASDLPQGILEDNLGLQLVVVCTKSDVLDSLEKNRRYSEETFDFIQQVLRTICLRYGAALFFTSTHKPTTLSTLKSYILHRLFHSSSFTEETGSTSMRTFPFPYRANVVDRDALIIPAGWDSWGKIKVLRDVFDARGTSSAWQALLNQHIKHRDNELDVEAEQAGETLLNTWSHIVRDDSTQTSASKVALTKVLGEQEFLRTHFDLIAKDKDNVAHQQQTSHQKRPSTMTRSPSAAAEMGVAGPGTVGPMASSALHLPSVEKALGVAPDPDASIGSANLSDRHHARQDSGRLGEATEKFARLSSRKDSTSNPKSPVLSSTTGASSPPPPAGAQSGQPGTQNEVLANFFQSLLSKRKDSMSKGKSDGTASTSPKLVASSSPPPAQ